MNEDELTLGDILCVIVSGLERKAINTRVRIRREASYARFRHMAQQQRMKKFREST